MNEGAHSALMLWDGVVLLGAALIFVLLFRRLGLGAVLGSAVWFLGLGYGAHRAHRLLSRPRSWQVLDALIGVVMLLLAVTLARTDLG